MKKITLKNLNLKEVEQLSREQLKDVLGGDRSATSSETSCENKCTGSENTCVTSKCKPGVCYYTDGVYSCVST